MAGPRQYFILESKLAFKDLSTITSEMIAWLQALAAIAWCYEVMLERKNNGGNQ